METKSKEMFWFLKGILSALLISAMGFGVLFVLYINWASLYPNSTLPGLFEFKAASIGDSILLPIIIGSFVFYNRKLNLDIKNKGSIINVGVTNRAYRNKNNKKIKKE